MRRSRWFRWIPVGFAIVASLVMASPSYAQTDGYVTNSNLRGEMSFGTYYKGDIDNINLATGTVNLKIPLINRKGRGIDTGEDVFYSSKLWVLKPIFDVNGNLSQMQWVPSSEPTAYLQIEGTSESGNLEWTPEQYTCNFNVGSQLEKMFVTIQSNFLFIGPDGAKYQFPNVVVTKSIPNHSLGDCNTPPNGPAPPPPNAISIPTGYSDSGTLELNTSTTPYVVSFKDGRQALNNGSVQGTFELMDPNGNMGENTDTVGRTAYTDSSGGAVTFTLGQKTFPVPATQFPTTAGGCILQDARSVAEIPSLQLPNGQSYTFTYDPNFGEITEVTLPTGGYIKYVYQTIPQMDQNPFTIVLNGRNNCYTGLLDSRRVVERHVSADGVTEAVWHYAYSVAPNSGGFFLTYQTTVTDPLGNVQVHTFPQLNETDPGHETEKDNYDNAGHLLGKTVNVWAADSGPVQINQDGSSVWSIKNARITSTTTTLEDTGQVKQVTTVYDKSNTYSTLTIPSSATESRMNVMETDEYDWGPGAAGPLLRKTVYDYLHYDNSAYLNLHIWNRVSSKTIYDNASNTCQGVSQPCAKSTYKYDSTAITATSGVVSHDYTGHSSTFTTRGNLTETDAWRNTDGATLVSQSFYDDLGNVVKTLDPKTNPTTFSYADSWTTGTGSACAPASGSTGAYPTQITDALGHVTTHTYFSCSSLTGSTTDPNNQTMSMTYDHLDRMLTEVRPDTGQTTYTYNDPTAPTTSNPVSAQLQSTIGNGTNLQKTVLIDGLGRVNTFQLADPQGTDLLGITYDGIGRVSCETNPYRTTSDPTYGTTCTTYDGLGRPISVTKADGSVVTTSYSGNCTTVTDEAGKARESCADGLGRVTKVLEDPGSSPHLNYETDYTYDALGNLLSSVQSGSRQRSFTYNSLSQLLTATNPESGTVTYTYDNDGNVATKKDARAITTTYSYNAINQVLSVTYSNGDPAVYFNYDGNTQTNCTAGITDGNPKGRRTGMCDAAGSEAWTHDSMGRELTDQRTTNSVTKSTKYTYNLLGETNTLTYPSGRVITYTYDSAGRPSLAQDVTNSINYVVGTCANGVTSTGVCYTPFNALQTATMNATANFAGFAVTDSYNVRLQPSELKAAGVSTFMDLSYCYYALLSTGACPSTGTTDNGDVMGVISNTDATRSQTFTYDALNRITTGSSVATSGTNCWAEKFGYDTWGNLLSMSSLAGFTGCTEPDHLSVAMTAANQISGYTYDPSGNLTVIPGTGGATYTYNGESELTTTTAGVNYTYDGDGQRVEKSNGTLFWYGMGGEVLEETGLTGGFMEDYVFFAGSRVARMDSSKDIFAYFEDHLGTARVMQKIVPGASTSTLVYDADFRPFGRESILTQTGNPLYKFDGKRRDTESNLDDFGARYYSFTIGRFMSADWSAVPAPVPYANLTNPQTLNLYAMVSDNPETFADLDGHSAEGATEQSDTLAEDGQPSDCAELEGCAEYELQISDGDNDTATEQNNADARANATVDGTQQEKQQNAGTPAPTNPDGTPANPPVPPPPGADGKPNDWVRTPGKDGKPDQWDPREPVPNPKGGQPRARWDEKNGHWDIDDGNKNRTRYLPDGTKVDHNNKPIPTTGVWDSIKAIPPRPVASLGTAAIIIYLIVSEGSRGIPLRNLVPIP